jgi:putative DNA primase/helicase
MSKGYAIKDVPTPEPLLPVTGAELLGMSLPVRPKLLAPVIPTAGLVMLYAPRGMGKTYAALSIAYAVASGGPALRWSAPEPRRVLYVDGEMPAATLQERLGAIVRGADRQPPEDDYLQFLPADLREMGLPNLGSEPGQKAIADAASTADLLILDNLSSLASGMRENEADDWSPMQAWLLSLRRAGKAVLLIHHAGKGGQQRGTSRREDVMDTVIALRRPEDYRPEEGARFAVHLEKARGLTGADTSPFEAALFDTGSGGLSWTVKDLATAQQDRALALLMDGLSLRDVAEETGLSKSAVHRIKKRMDGGGADGRH